MTTPAQERFERIFGGKPRPAKHEPRRTSMTPTKLTEPKVQQDVAAVDRSLTKESTRPSETQQIWRNADRDNKHLQPTWATENLLAENQPFEPFLSNESGVPHHTNDDTDQLQREIEFIPNGKGSVTGSETTLEKGVSHDWTGSSCDGNGQNLIGQFCIFSLVAKFPYKYMKDPDDKVSRKFFASNRVYKRQWNIHYLHAPDSFSKGPLILVPKSQVQGLIDDISSTFGINVRVPSSPFTLNFYADDTPQPVFLGNSNSRDSFNDLVDDIPEPRIGYGECPSIATAEVAQAFKAFHKKIESAMLASKGKSKSAAQKRESKLFQILEESRGQLKRAQRYLGLRPEIKSITLSSASHSGFEKIDLSDAQKRSCGMVFGFINVHRPTEYACEEQPIIISVDVESYERNHGLITEIGISTLDTQDLVNTPPGDKGDDWIKQIRSKHFRIRGREHLINKDFCIGNPDTFQFGQSEFVTLADIANAVDDCFEWPISSQIQTEPSNQPAEVATEKGQTTGIRETAPENRKIILLGHDIHTDVQYLRNLGSAIFNPLPANSTTLTEGLTTGNRNHILTSIIETLDTATLYRVFRGELQPRNLAHICTELGIEAWHPHNAGNDARYTLEALIKLVITSRLEEDKGQRLREPNSTGITEDEQEFERMLQLNVRVQQARDKLRRQLEALEDIAAGRESTSDDTHGSKSTHEAGPLLPIPIRINHHAASKELDVSMEEQIRRYYDAYEAEAATALWPVGPECPPPKQPRAGW